MYDKLKKLSIKRRCSLHTALMAALTVALVASAAVFMSVSAAEENVSPSDVSGSDTPKSSVSRSVSHVEVTPSDVSPTDVPKTEITRAIIGHVIAPEMYATPENLGEPVITMTTGMAVGETLNLEITGSNVYVDFGDGSPVEYPGDMMVKGSNIRVYGDNITTLSCNDGQLTALDVSNNTSLTNLSCYDNQLTALNLSSNTTLDSLDCSVNQLTSLDVSDCTVLSNLFCSANQLTSLDVSNNISLRTLICQNNPLGALDVSNNTVLGDIICDNTQLTSLDVSKNPNLINLWCQGNQLTSLDVSNNTSLKNLYCSGNQLTSLDVSKNTALERFNCDYNQLTSLDLTKNAVLTELQCESNLLTSLDIAENAPLNIAWCKNNYLSIGTINTIHNLNVDQFEYAPQTHVIPASVKAGESINLSSEYSADGTMSEFVWYDSDGNIISPATANGGVFTFYEDAVGKTLICMITNDNLPDFTADKEVFAGWDEESSQPIFNIQDTRLTTTAVKIEAADSASSENPVSSEDPVSSEETVSSDNNSNNNDGYVQYYDLSFEQNDGIDDVKDVKYPEGTLIDVNGQGVDLHSVKGIHLTVGNIQTNKKKSVLDAIKHYNETFDTDTTDIALYDISLVDSNNAHVKVVGGEILVCLKYPDNLARQAEDYVFHLYHQKEDGTIEEIPVTLRPNGIWFRAKDFSPYVLYWHEKAVESAGTGESLTLILVMTALCALSLAGAGYVLYRRKKHTEE